MIKKNVLFTILSFTLIATGCTKPINTPATQIKGTNVAKLSVTSSAQSASSQTDTDTETNDDNQTGNDVETNDDPLK